jgi:hypothetical protein
VSDINAHAQRYFTLAADPDQAAYVAQFADDAVVEDENRTHHGRAAIAVWRADVPRVTYSLREVDPADGGYRARAEIAGDFPGSPLTLTFAVGLDVAGAISSLRIRP